MKTQHCVEKTLPEAAELLLIGMSCHSYLCMSNFDEFEIPKQIHLFGQREKAHQAAKVCTDNNDNKINKDSKNSKKIHENQIRMRNRSSFGQRPKRPASDGGRKK